MLILDYKDQLTIRKFLDGIIDASLKIQENLIQNIYTTSGNFIEDFQKIFDLSVFRSNDRFYTEMASALIEVNSLPKTFSIYKDMVRIMNESDA